ncbi:hypothetical protein ACP275_08G127600 [Erythranthe tilingii]
MKTSGFAMLSSLVVVVVVVVSVTTTSYSAEDAFIKCIENNSKLFNGGVFLLQTPSSPSFSSSLQTYIRNLRFNQSTAPKPTFILTPSHVSHIQTSIICAKSHRLQIKLRSGGHDFEGLSYVSDSPNFFILDMFNLRSVNVTLEDESAWVEAGATLGEVFYGIAGISNTHAFPAGVCPTVGVGGHVSSGGYGNLMRKFGLSVDNVVDAKIVDVKGRILDRKSMGEDLFWAITGGGGSSFGVVLSYKIKLVRVPNRVTVFSIFRTYDENFTHLIHRYQKVAADELPEKLFIRLILDVANGKNRARFVALFLGNSENLLSLMNRRFPELGLKQKDCIKIRWIESVLFWADFPTGTPITALLSRVPQVLAHFKRKSDYLKKPIPKSGLEFIFKKMVELKTPLLTFNPYGGRMAEIPPEAKPFPHRGGNIAKIQYAANWDEKGIEAANYYINLTRMLYEYMTPYVSVNPREAFLCYRDLDIGTNRNGGGNGSYYSEDAAVYGVKYFMDNFKRLVKIKTKFDPDNFFRDEQSIPSVRPEDEIKI